MNALYHYEAPHWWVEDDCDPSWAGIGGSLSEVVGLHAEVFGADGLIGAFVPTAALPSVPEGAPE